MEAGSGARGGARPGDLRYRDRAEDFAQLNATVVGISARDVESHAAVTARHALTVPLLADNDHSVARAYGAHAGPLAPRAR